ncbi:hypothetical protein LCGC14_0795370 [marine sediment metagenome]|uniref:Alpha/beta hydrolase n=1 Tax=marine sediment metagenome TaxID=412755 RepID=A0A0F9PRC9_9ZZZZ
MTNNSKTGTIEVPYASLGYKILGQGIPTILIGDTVMAPRVMPQAMLDHFKIAFLDSRIYAQGTTPEKGFSLQLLADDIEALRTHLGWDKVVVM